MLDGLAKAVCCVIALFWSLATVGIAAPITYLFSGTGSGTIGGATFTNAPYVIALSGDTNVIDYTWQNLAVWSNAVQGTFQVKGLKTAAIAESIVIATSCGAGRGLIGFEPTPSGPYLTFSYIFNTQGVPDIDCYLGPVAPTTGLPATVGTFVNVQSTKRPITLTSSSFITYQAETCTAPKSRTCRKQSKQTRRAILKLAGD